MSKSKSHLFEAMKAKMPSTDEIASKGLEYLSHRRNLNADTIKKKFSILLSELERECYNVYLREEARIGEEIVRNFVLEKGSSTVFPDLNKFFLSLSQSRKARAGKTFESSITVFLHECGYVFEEQTVINGKPDFVFPSKKYYEHNAPDCIVLTAKRTLRERWRQIATEGTRGRKALFLATLDNDQSRQQLIEMLNNGINLVVPVNLKTGIDHYSESPNVISFEDFFLDHLDPAMIRWKRNKII